MKNIVKKVIALALVVTLTLSLSACGKSSYNTEAPYGSISGNYANNGDDVLTNKQLYDILRPGGFNVFYNLVEEIILESYVSAIDFNNEDDKKEMFDLLNEIVFETDDIEEINKIKQKDLDLMLEQFVDSMYTSNIVFAANDIKVTENGVTYPEVLFDQFILDLAKQRFGVDELTRLIAKGEKYEDEDGEEVENEYFISEEDIEKYYNDTFRHQQDYHAVIVGYNTLADYNAAVSGVITEGSFITLYNNAFPYKTNITDVKCDATIINADKLSNYNEGLALFVENMEAGDFTKTYKEFGDKYYMVYKVTDLADDEWADLAENDIKEGYEEEIRQEIFDTKMTDSFISSQISEKIEELISEDKIVINDPVFGLVFETKFEDFKYNIKKLEDTTNVATINGKNIAVNTLYDLLAKYFGVAASVEYFTSVALAQSDYASELTSDDKKTAQSSYDSELKKFKNNEFASTGITKHFTEKQFLMMKYGFDNKNDVLKYHFEPIQITSYLAEDYSDTYFALLSLMGENNYNNFFNLDIKHVLLFVDYDMDGNLDDPEDFMKELNSTQKNNFEQTILEIYRTVEAEAEALSGSYSANLEKIVTMFNRGEKLASNTSKNWNDVKGNFNIQMKVETLGVVDNASASSYVPEFSDHVEQMYIDIYNDTMDNTTLDNEDPNFIKNFLKELQEVLDEEHLENITTYDKLCMSPFGYHMLLSTGGSVPTSAKFTKDEDWPEETDDEYFRYENIKVYIDEDEKEFLELNGYSDYAFPSLDQLKIYVYESDTDDGVESLKSSTETIISEFYSSFEKRYTDKSFISYLIYTTLEINITFTDSTIESDMMTQWFTIIEKTLDEYKDSTEGSTHGFAGWWEVFKDPASYLAQFDKETE